MLCRVVTVAESCCVLSCRAVFRSLCCCQWARATAAVTGTVTVTAGAATPEQNQRGHIHPAALPLSWCSDYPRFLLGGSIAAAKLNQRENQAAHQEQLLSGC